MQAAADLGSAAASNSGSNTEESNIPSGTTGWFTGAAGQLAASKSGTAFARSVAQGNPVNEASAGLTQLAPWQFTDASCAGNGHHSEQLDSSG